jgi:hypothetical protein
MDGEPRCSTAPEASAASSPTPSHFDFFEFVILNTVIDIDGDAAPGRVHLGAAS